MAKGRQRKGWMRMKEGRNACVDEWDGMGVDGLDWMDG